MESNNTIRFSYEDLPKKALNFGETSKLNHIKKTAWNLNFNLYSLILEFFEFRDLFKLRQVNKFQFFERAVPLCFRVLEIGDSKIQVDHLNSDLEKENKFKDTMYG